MPAAIAAIAPRLETYSRLVGDDGYACHGRLTVADCSAMPSLWRLLHAGALDAQRSLRTLGRDRRRAPGLGVGRRRERGAGVITSRTNARVRAARALGEAKERRRTGLFLDEGEDALRAALAAGIAPVEAFVDDDLGSDRIADELSPHVAKVHRCSGEVMAALSSLAHTSRAVGVFRANDLPPLAAGSPASQVGLQLHGVSDPGNLGTLLRSAQGFGPAHVALAEGCADPLSPRAVRASMGALYSVPVITLREAPELPLVALDARGEHDARAARADALRWRSRSAASGAGLPDDVARSRRRAVARIDAGRRAPSRSTSRSPARSRSTSCGARPRSQT